MSNDALSRYDEAPGPRGQVLRLLRDGGAMPRVSLSKLTGLSATSITRVVNQLIADGFVEEGKTILSSRLGRPATEVALRVDSSFVVGVQIGVGSVQLGLIDVLGGVIDSRDFAYDTQLSADKVLAIVGAETNSFLSERDRARVLGVGVGVPGPVDITGRRILLPINLNWSDVAVADILESVIGLPVTVEHNVRSMALAESRFGAGRALGSVGFVYLRTGLGAGLVVEGQPFAGGVHGAIEVGHMRTSDRGLQCVCGGTGCLETIVSERALRQRVDEAGIDAGGESPLSVLVKAADEGNVVAAEAVREIVSQLAVGLSTLVNLLNPELILLGGAFTDAPATFLNRLRDETRHAVFPVLRPFVRLEPSSLGATAGVIGGGAIALDRYFYA